MLHFLPQLGGLQCLTRVTQSILAALPKFGNLLVKTSGHTGRTSRATSSATDARALDAIKDAKRKSQLGLNLKVLRCLILQGRPPSRVTRLSGFSPFGRLFYVVRIFIFWPNPDW